MQDTTGRIRHLVEFVDTADTPITQNQGTTKIIDYKLTKGNTSRRKSDLSSTSCFESGSRVTYAVKPTADEPLPEVNTPRGAILWTY